MATAELGMYPFTSVIWAWDALWELLRERAGWLPERLAHSGDVHARWDDPDCLVNHVCGWPLARRHADDQRVLGAFSLTIPEADGYRYRSTLVSPHDVALAELLGGDVRVVANSADSLSGWISLLNALGPDARLPGEITWTTAHVESLRALAAAGADLACIDSWSLALIAGEQPELVRVLHRIALGPWIPSPAVTVRDTVPAGDGEQFADALVAVLADEASAPIREALLIDGFVRLTIDDYRPVLTLRSSLT